MDGKRFRLRWQQKSANPGWRLYPSTSPLAKNERDMGDPSLVRGRLPGHQPDRSYTVWVSWNSEDDGEKTYLSYGLAVQKWTSEDKIEQIRNRLRRYACGKDQQTQ